MPLVFIQRSGIFCLWLVFALACKTAGGSKVRGSAPNQAVVPAARSDAFCIKGPPGVQVGAHYELEPSCLAEHFKEMWLGSLGTEEELLPMVLVSQGPQTVQTQEGPKTISIQSESFSLGDDEIKFNNDQVELTVRDQFVYFINQKAPAKMGFISAKVRFKAELLGGQWVADPAMQASVVPQFFLLSDQADQAAFTALKAQWKTYLTGDLFGLASLIRSKPLLAGEGIGAYVQGILAQGDKATKAESVPEALPKNFQGGLRGGRFHFSFTPQ